MTTFKYSLKRNEIYHFNYRLSDKVYRKSLKTDSPSLCRTHVSDIIYFIRKAKQLGIKVNKTDIDKFIEMLISNKVNELARLGKAITEPLSTTADHYFNQWFEETNRERINQFDYDNAHNMPSCYVRPAYKSYTNWMHSKLNAVANKNPLGSEITSFDDETNSNDYDTQHPYYKHFQFPTVYKERHVYLDNLVNSYAKNMAQAYSVNGMNRLKVELNTIQNSFSELLPNQSSSVVKKASISSFKENELKSFFLNDIKEDFFKYLKLDPRLGANSIRNKKSEFKDLEIAFEDLAINDITVDDIEERWASICRLPKLDDEIAIKYGFYDTGWNLKGEDKKKKMREIRWSLIFNTEESYLPTILEKDLLGEAQIKKLKTLLTTFLAFAKRKKYLHENPITEFSLQLNIPKNRSKERTALPKDKANLIVMHCFKNLDNPYSWATLLMAYQGMRNKEVTSLTASQIITDEETSVVYINILKGKTKNAKRKIPVHKQLIKIGFLDFVYSKLGQKLFDFNSNQLTNKFTFYRDKFDIPKIDHDGNQLVLYSFRHNVVSALGEVSNEFKYRLIGHGYRTVTANYTKLCLLRAQELINKVDYEL